MQPRRVLITGAAGTIGSVLRPALRERVEELRLSDVVAIDDLTGPETFVAADLTDAAAVQAAVDGADAVVHLGAVPVERPFEEIAGPNLHGAFHVFEACRRAPLSPRGEYELPLTVQQAIDDGRFPVEAVCSEEGVLDLSGRADVAAVAARLAHITPRL